MAMGIVSSKDFEKEKEQLSKVQDTIPIPPQIKDLEPSKVGRGKGNVEIPEALRMIIGEESVINGRASALELAQNFGISASSVSAYSKGATSTASIDNPTLEQLTHINKAKLRVGKRAKAKLLLALTHITEEKLANAKVHEVSGVARDMATIMTKMEPVNAGDMSMNNSGPTFVFFKPETKSEDDYSTVHVRE